MNKQLRKSSNKQLCGVCAGIAEYFDLDPTIVRIAWLAWVLIGGSGILAYLAAVLIMPEN